MDTIARAVQVGRRRRGRRGEGGRGIGLLSLLLAAGLQASGCGSLRTADEPLEGRTCDGGVCPYDLPDRISGPFTLAPSCLATSPGLRAQQVTLSGAGDRFVVAGAWVDAEGQPLPGEATGVLTLALRPGSACPEIAAADPIGSERVFGGGHTVAGGGQFLAFAGGSLGSTELVAYDGVSWSSRPLPQSPPEGDVAPAASAWVDPNALVVRLPRERALVVRQAWPIKDLAAKDPALRLELFDLGSDPATLVWQGTRTKSEGEAVMDLAGRRGQLHAFLVPPPSSAEDSPGQGDGITLLGEAGIAVSLRLGTEPDIQVLASSRRSLIDPASSRGAAAVLLPFRPRMPSYAPGGLLYVSGSSAAEGAPKAEDFRRIDRFDPATGTWTREEALLPAHRYFATAVLLPDGKVAIVGGDRDDTQIFYVDPRNGFRASGGQARLGRARGTEVGAILAADGRVLVTGGRPADDPSLAPGTDEAGSVASPDFDLLEPPYLASGRARPRIAYAPPVIATAGAAGADPSFVIGLAPDAPGADEIVLMAFGSTLLSNNVGQRLIELAVEVDREGRTLTVAAPPASWAPAGRYLLFALSQRIPSIAVAVQVVN